MMLESFMNEEKIGDAFNVFLRMAARTIPYKTETFNRMFRELFKDPSKHVMAWNAFDQLKNYGLPSIEIINNVIFQCGEHDRAEQALKIYRDYSKYGLVANAKTYEALIRVLSLRKEYFSEAFALAAEMEEKNFDVTPETMAHLIYSCSKSNDLETGFKVWKQYLEKYSVLILEKRKPKSIVEELTKTCSGFLQLSSIKITKLRLEILSLMFLRKKY